MNNINPFFLTKIIPLNSKIDDKKGRDPSVEINKRPKCDSNMFGLPFKKSITNTVSPFEKSTQMLPKPVELGENSKSQPLDSEVENDLSITQTVGESEPSSSPNKFKKRVRRKKYSSEDDEGIIEIVRRINGTVLGPGLASDFIWQKIWKQCQRVDTLKDRSMSSLKFRFLQNIQPRLMAKMGDNAKKDNQAIHEMKQNIQTEITEDRNEKEINRREMEQMHEKLKEVDREEKFEVEVNEGIVKKNQPPKKDKDPSKNRNFIEAIAAYIKRDINDERSKKEKPNIKEDEEEKEEVVNRKGKKRKYARILETSSESDTEGENEEKTEMDQKDEGNKKPKKENEENIIVEINEENVNFHVNPELIETSSERIMEGENDDEYDKDLITEESGRKEKPKKTEDQEAKNDVEVNDEVNGMDKKRKNRKLLGTTDECDKKAKIEEKCVDKDKVEKKKYLKNKKLIKKKIKEIEEIINDLSQKIGEVRELCH